MKFHLFLQSFELLSSTTAAKKWSEQRDRFAGEHRERERNSRARTDWLEQQSFNRDANLERQLGEEVG